METSSSNSESSLITMPGRGWTGMGPRLAEPKYVTQEVVL